MCHINITKHHTGGLIEDILLISNHITLHKNTPTCLPPNQTQKSILPDITTASADLHDCNRWQSIHSLTSNHLFLLKALLNLKKPTH